MNARKKNNRLLRDESSSENILGKFSSILHLVIPNICVLNHKHNARVCG